MENKTLRAYKDLLEEASEDFGYSEPEIKKVFEETCKLLESKILEEESEKIVGNTEITRDSLEHFSKSYEMDKPELAKKMKRDYHLMDNMIEKFQEEPCYENLEILRRLGEVTRDKILHLK